MSKFKTLYAMLLEAEEPTISPPLENATTSGSTSEEKPAGAVAQPVVAPPVENNATSTPDTKKDGGLPPPASEKNTEAKPEVGLDENLTSIYELLTKMDFVRNPEQLSDITAMNKFSDFSEKISEIVKKLVSEEETASAVFDKKEDNSIDLSKVKKEILDAKKHVFAFSDGKDHHIAIIDDEGNRLIAKVK